MVDFDMTPPPSMSEAATKAAIISTQIMIVAVVILFLVVAFCFCLHIYVKCFYINNYEDPIMAPWRRQLAEQRRTASVPAHRRGLDVEALQSMPVVVYDPKNFKDGLECAVCLSEVSEGEKARILPKCNHGFHVECIDMWFKSHSTCPLCRDPVISTSNDSNNDSLQVQHDEEDDSYTSELYSDSDNEYDSPNAVEVPVYPTNVLFWGNETRVSTFGQAANAASSSESSSSGVSKSRRNDELVIEIPSHMFCEDCSSSVPPFEEAKTPVTTRLRSLRRLLSMGNKRVAPSTSDVEQQV